MHVITLKLLSKAIAHKLEYTPTQARRTAEFLLDLFGYNDRIIDNVLDPVDRQLFYLLQTVGILSNGRDESILYDGREWRTHYWQLERDRITDYACQPQQLDYIADLPKPKTQDTEYDTVYYSLTEEVWSARRIDHKKHSFLQ